LPKAVAQSGGAFEPKIHPAPSPIPGESPRSKDSLGPTKPAPKAGAALSENALRDLSLLNQEALGKADKGNEYEDLLRMKDEGVRARISSKTIDFDALIVGSYYGEARRRAHGLISWWVFDACVGVVIVANAFTIGVETSYIVDGFDVPYWVVVLEGIFLAVYVVELGLRYFAYGLVALRSHWVKFDSFLVFCGLLDVIMKLVMSGEGSVVLDKIMLVRMLRLVRLARAARLVIQFRTLWLLVQGLYLSLLPMFWTFIITFMVVYIFGIAGIELIRSTSEYGPEYQRVAEANFGSLGQSMMTMMQMIGLDSATAVYRPLITERPELSIYFICFMLIGAIALMNLVTAIMVESAMRQAKDDQDAQKAWEELKRKQLAPVLNELFTSMDADGSGELEIDEIMEATDEQKDQLKRICNMDDIEEVFKMLDYDDSGALSIDEFIDGILRVKQEKPAELLRIVKQCSDILNHCKCLWEVMNPDGQTVKQRCSVYVPKSGSDDQLDGQVSKDNGEQEIQSNFSQQNSPESNTSQASKP
jgi:voltage-gated sodium channel